MTGITGWRRDTASDLRTPAKSSRTSSEAPRPSDFSVYNRAGFRAEMTAPGCIHAQKCARSSTARRATTRTMTASYARKRGCCGSAGRSTSAPLGKARRCGSRFQREAMSRFSRPTRSRQPRRQRLRSEAPAEAPGAYLLLPGFSCPDLPLAGLLPARAGALSKADSS